MSDGDALEEGDEVAELQKQKLEIEKRLEDAIRKKEQKAAVSEELTVGNDISGIDTSSIGATRTSRTKETFASRTHTVTTISAIDPVEGWLNTAFGSVASSYELETRINLLNNMLEGEKVPGFLVLHPQPITLERHAVGKEVFIRGTLDTQSNVNKGKGKEKLRGKIQISITQFSEMVPYSSALTTSVIHINIVESGVGKQIFHKLVTALQTNNGDDKRVVLLAGFVQRIHNNIFICINKKSHVLLICVKPPEYPVVHDMDGIPITFPMHTNSTNSRQLQGFSGCWFCPMSDSKLSEDQVNQLSNHISAYRTSGGGVIYLGLKRKCISPGEFQVENVAFELSHQQLEDLKKQIENTCNVQCPPCCAQEWNVNDSRMLPDRIKQMYDNCFNSYFTAPNDKPDSSHCRYVVRMVVCPSEHPLHLGSESDIGLRRRHGETSSFYPIGEFVSKMLETSSEVEQELEAMSGMHNSTSAPPTSPTVINGESYPLWRFLPSESSDLDNKECSIGDPVNFTKCQLEDYGAMWLNDSIVTCGTLRIGVSNMPPLATGVWLDEEATLSLKDKLTNRFKGSLNPQEFCFPSAVDCFTLKKHQVFAGSDALLTRSSKVLVLWLKVPQNEKYKNGFEPFDNVRRSFYRSCMADKECPTLTKLFDSKREHLPLVLPLNFSLKGLVPPSECSFPVAITKPRKLNHDELDKLIDDLLEKMKAPGLESVVSHQFIDVTDATHLLDASYCVLDVIVSPKKQNLLYLCKLPEFWKLEKSPENEEEHIGGTLKKMDFQEIFLRCGDSSRLAANDLSTFFQFNDRPILITDVGTHDGTVTKGLASIPWTLVIDFDFDNKTNTLRDLADKAEYVYKISDLSLNKDDPVNSEDISDASFVYWVKALGPSNDPANSLSSWDKHLALRLCKYVAQACITIAPSVKILVVWSVQTASSGFGRAIAELCSAALRAQPLHTIEIAVVSPAVVSPFLTKFRNYSLSCSPKVLSMELASLSRFLLQHGLTGTTNDDWCRVPKTHAKLPVETVRSMQSGGLEYLYHNFEKHLDITTAGYDSGLAFFEGRAKFVRWEDFKAQNVVKRQVTQTLYKRVEASLRNSREREISMVHFTHHSGAGGSTVARDVLWRLRKEFCCIVPSQMYQNLRQDVKQLVETSEGRAVLVLCDSNLGIDIDALVSALKGTNAVILHVERFSGFSEKAARKMKIHLEEMLSLEVLQDFNSLLSKNIHLSKSKEALDLLFLCAERMKEQVPLFLVMVTATEGRFLRLRDYVKERLINITEEQKYILLQIAFARVYTDKALQVSAVDAKDKKWENSLPSSVLGLITFYLLQSRCVRTRHHCIDELVLSELSGHENTSQEWGFWLADFVVKFIEHLRHVYPNIPEGDSSGYNEFERVLRLLFHGKSYYSEIPHLPNFLSMIGKLAGTDAAIMCMRKVEEKLPHIKRILAHFLADLARVHLYINDMDLKAALTVMKEAHLLLPNNRTLYHQEGLICFNAMKMMELNANTLLVPKAPAQLASDLIMIAKQASDCFAISRKCKIQGRTNVLYLWSTDVQCHIECLSDICSVMKCSFHTLPESLATDKYILNAEDSIMLLLDMLSTEDPGYYDKWRLKMLVLLGSKEDHKHKLEGLLKSIEEEEDLKVLAKKIMQISCFMRWMYNCSARHVPQSLCTHLTQAIIKLIEQPRAISNSVFAQKGHKDRFFELELLWEWARYAKPQVSRIGMLSIIDRYMENLTNPSLLRAKCKLFKGITLLLQLLCDNNLRVNPEEIMQPISDCNKDISEYVLQHENRNWRYSEFLIEGYGNDLLSSKDWYWNGSLHQAVNDNAGLNVGYEEDQRANFREFSGHVYGISHDGRQGSVSCEGVRLSFVPKNAPESWRVNYGVVKFYILVSSQKGLQAYPVCLPGHHEADKYRTQIHHWIPFQLQKGCIYHIDKKEGLVYLVPPDPAQPYKAKVCCRIDDLQMPPEKGDLYEFCVTKVSKSNFVASELRFVTSAVYVTNQVY